MCSDEGSILDSSQIRELYGIRVSRFCTIQPGIKSGSWEHDHGCNLDLCAVVRDAVLVAIPICGIVCVISARIDGVRCMMLGVDL